MRKLISLCLVILPLGCTNDYGKFRFSGSNDAGSGQSSAALSSDGGVESDSDASDDAAAPATEATRK